MVMVRRGWRLIAAVLLMGLGAWAAPARAAYPDRVVRIVVAFPPGGAADLAARLVADHLARALGQPVVVDNRPGGNTMIAAEAATRAAPDGHTLLIASTATMAIVPRLFAGRVPYDPERDLVPVGMISRLPFFVFVPASLPAQDLPALLELARRRPGQLNYGSNGTGTVGHIGAEMLKRATGIDVMHVPYRSYVLTIPDLLSGHLSFVLADLTVFGGLLQEGKVRALAAVMPQRSPFLPEVPATSEFGFLDLDASVWFGMFAPRGTPAAILERLNAELRSYLATEGARAGLARIHQVPSASSPGGLRAAMRADADRYGRVIQEAGITAE